ncbi:MAG TPA: porphobilinogen synthase [bacterium]|nr:porphobilinogen synthase [bacterium]
MTEFKRFRCRRADEAARLKHRETFLSAADFIWPVFLVEGMGIRQAVPSMPGVCRYSADRALKELEKLVRKGLRSVILFGVPKKKGVEQAYRRDGIVQRSIRAVKERFPALEIISDVCVCSYTPTGHCHIGDNDRTCELLAEVALSHAEAGADCVAPSDMMDGRVLHIKRRLRENRLGRVRIMSYAAKYASGFYGPFRDAAECAPKSGDRKSYQMDPANREEAMEEIRADLEEGADSVIVKPALPYLDVIYQAKRAFPCPVIAYNVSGEYAMVLALSGGLRESVPLMEETLVSIKRAGADRIITYFAPAALEMLNEKK